MKKIILLFVFISSIVISCDEFDLNQLDNPNDPKTTEGDVNALYNQIQIDFSNIHFALEDQTGELTRMYNATSQNYGNATLPSVFDNLWTNVYAGLLPDIDAMEDLIATRPMGLDIHIGTARILKAIVLMEMVDVFGDIPYSEAGQGVANLNPNVDEGSVVYDSALALLESAITLLKGTDNDTPTPDYDNFYGGKAAPWITLANTFKLRAAYLKKDATTFNDIVTAGNIIDATSEDFQVNYGSNRLNPDSRHPRYANQYEQIDGDYMSNYYMWLLRGDKLDTDGTTELRDPRLRYYFYRKVSNSNRQPGDSYGCVLDNTPDQTTRPAGWDAIEPRLPFCYGGFDGYTGRDHLNGSGIPADGAIRTAYGLYPAAGDFDNNEYKNTQNGGTTGGLGQGILPIMLASYVDFMRADMALVGGGEGEPKALLVSGVQKSLAKVRSFESLVATKLATEITINGVKTTVQDAFAMNDSSVARYVSLVERRYDEARSKNKSATSKRDVIIKEWYIAAFGNGLEAYNMYRKTGLPANMEPPLQENAGDFPRSLRYANAFVDRNSSVSQKEETEIVFWNTDAPNLPSN